MIYLHDRQEVKRPTRPAQPLKWPTPSSEHTGLMIDYLQSRSLHVGTARANGWYPAVFAIEENPVPRLVIPCQRTDGWPYWQARDMTGTAPVRYASPFTPRRDAIVWLSPKTANYNTAVAICEGPMDALAVVGLDLGIAAIALMGNDPGDAVWGHVRRVIQPFKRVYVVPDSDALGTVSRKWLTELSRAAQSITLVLPSPAKDFAELSLEQRKQKFANEKTA